MVSRLESICRSDFMLLEVIDAIVRNPTRPFLQAVPYDRGSNITVPVKALPEALEKYHEEARRILSHFVRYNVPAVRTIGHAAIARGGLYYGFFRQIVANSDIVVLAQTGKPEKFKSLVVHEYGHDVFQVRYLCN